MKTRLFLLPSRALGLAAGILSLTLPPWQRAMAAEGAPVPENLGLGLRELVQAHGAAKGKAGTEAGDLQARVAADFPLARVDDKARVIVDIYPDGTRPSSETEALIVSLGGTVIAKIDWYRHGLFSAWMPIGQVSALGNGAGVASASLSLRPHHRVGKTTSQGTIVHKTALVTSYRGAGVMVGALSDSYDKLKTTGTGTTAAPLFAPVRAADDVTSGDLPGTNNPNGFTTPVNVIKDYTSSTGVEDEGRAMLQIIHDMAPAATLAFYTADVSEADFAAGIIALKNAGCKIICDDVGYFDEPMFSDGVVAQAVNQVVAAGVTYFSSAGNDSSSGYAANFNPVANNAAAQTALGAIYTNISATEKAVITDFHSFGTDSSGNPILVQNVRIPGTSADATGILVFQWDDPYNVTVGGVKQVTTDYDILLFNGTTNAILTSRSGQTNNISTNQPIEIPGTALAAATSYKIVIVRTNRSSAVGAGVTANQATRIRYAVETNDTPVRGDFIDPTTPNSYGHPVAAGCIGTAAFRYDVSPTSPTDTGHVFRSQPEQFSSNGPVQILFDSAGNRLPAPIVRKQPTLSAVNGVNTSFFPPDSVTSGTTPPAVPSPASPSPYDFDGDGYPNFFGTSAAAPSAAGVAAVLLSAAVANGVTLSPADVRSILISTTLPGQDQDPAAIKAVAGSVTVSSAAYGRTDPQAFKVAFNGAAGQTLGSIAIDLAPAGMYFDATVAIPTGASTTATATGVVVPTGGTTGSPAPSVASFSVAGGPSGKSVLTINFSNFGPGATLTFGVGRRNEGTNAYGQLSDALENGSLYATITGSATSTGTFTNTYARRWNYKTGYGLIDAQAAVNYLLGTGN